MLAAAVEGSVQELGSDGMAIYARGDYDAL